MEGRALWEKARRKPGRPRRGQGSKVISLSMERDLLARADDLAKNMGLTRAALIERGLKAVLAAEGRLAFTAAALPLSQTGNQASPRLN